jgi:hypothetical protein
MASIPTYRAPTTQLPSVYTPGSIGGAYTPSYGALPAGAAASPSGWQQVGQFAGSPTGAALINAGGAYLASKGQEKENEKDRALREQQLAQDARLQVARDLQARAQVGTDRPMGEAQNFNNRQMLQAAVAGGLFSGGARIAAPNGLSQFKPMQFDPALTRSMTDPTMVKAATANSIMNREADLLGTNPNLAQTDMGALGLGPLAPAGDPRMAAQERGQQLWNQQNLLWEDSLGQQKSKDMVALTGKKINPKTGLPKGYEIDPKTGELKKESFWKTKWGKAIKIGALGAATIATAGAASPALAAGIAAGSGAFQGATSGGGMKGALLGAAMGGATAGLGGGFGGAAGKVGTKAAVGSLSKAAAVAGAKQMLKDPGFYAGGYQIARGQ